MNARAPLAWTLAIALSAALLAACYGDGDRAAPAPGAPRAIPAISAENAGDAWRACQASDQAWVRRAVVAVLGRRPWGQAEVNAYEDIARGIDAVALDAGTTSADLARRGELSPGRRAVARALMADDDYRVRWGDFLRDALHVTRIEDKSLAACWGAPSRAPSDDGALAAWVRDHAASERGAPAAAFTMRDVASSAIELDDLSVVYRANLFAMMSKPLHGANLDPVALERSRREDFGGVFDAAYIHRSMTCLACHNSEYSATYDPDPTKNHAWPIPGLFEKALYGASSGIDPLRAHSALRFDGVGNAADGAAPYGWDAAACGAFARPTGDPLLGVDAYFGRLRGERVSVWDLEASLHAGADALAAGGSPDDPDAAFAFLVAENVVDQVWAEIMGSRLVVPNGFPRNSFARDTLRDLAVGFGKSHFSLSTLLLEILGNSAFNLAPPSAGCGASPYAMPSLFDPWTADGADPSTRGNGAGDGVRALSPRPLLRSLHAAMEWPSVAEYPSDPTFEAAIGVFLKDAAPGFRGMDFQARLTWESAYGACAPPAGSPDFIARLAARAAAEPGATARDAVIALKDRLIGEPSIDDAEAPLLEALLDAPLASAPTGALDAQLRRVCGVLVSTPQRMLDGLVPDDTRAVPRLTPAERGYRASCARAAAAIDGELAVQCGDDAARITASR